MDLLLYTSKSVKEILKEFGAEVAKGLTKVEAEKRLREAGPNELSSGVVYWPEILFRQVKSSFIYLLIAAVILSFLLGETIEGLMILLFLIINITLGFYQEYHSEKTLQLLKKYISSHVKVIRNSEEVTVPSREIVLGDIVVLETGDKILADIRFLETHNFVVDESVLTGESIPVEKAASDLVSPAKEIYQASNLGFSGTTVVNGKAKGVVLATGRETAIGNIARLEAETKHVSNFEKGISRFSSFILRLILIILIIVFLANVFLKKGDTNFIELAIFSIALAVSVVPEALPVVITFSLSRGALRLAKKKVVVKRLSAIEDLGGMEILCTDKTGTLTENVLTVAEISPQSSPDTLLYANLAASSLRKNRLEPFDVALWEKISQEERKYVLSCRQIADVPFDPVRRRNTVLVKKSGQFELIVRGAPEFIIALSSNLSSAKKKSLNKWMEEKGRQGERVLAIAKKTLAGQKSSRLKDNLATIENDLSLLGLIAFIDPLKASALSAIKQAGELGVKIIIITGDSREVAGAIAYQIGLVRSPGEVITAQELEKMPLPQQRKAVEKFAVFARVSPEEKYKIIELLQEKHEVGFLGEGINDAPALKVAGVSLVVQGAADIAREAADIILLKKDLKVVLDGVREGREVFINTTKYIRATLASNFGNFYAIAIASLLIDFLPMLPLQILLLNLLSDFPMIAISTDTVDKQEVSAPQRYNVKDITLIATILGFVSTIFDFIFFVLFSHFSPGILQTNWFIGSILTELVFLFSIRSKRFFLKSQPPSAILLWLTVLASLATVILPFSALGQEIFHFIKPSFNHLLIILAVVLIYFFCTETVKLMYYKIFNHSQNGEKALS